MTEGGRAQNPWCVRTADGALKRKKYRLRLPRAPSTSSQVFGPSKPTPNTCEEVLGALGTETRKLSGNLEEEQ